MIKMNHAVDHPRERILQAGIHLFSRRGFAATGVRELAEYAGVNLAMINYYYGSKIGVLKAIVDTFFTEYSRTVLENVAGEGPLETRIENLVRAVTRYLLANSGMMKIAVAEMPLDIPEVFEYKAQHFRQLKKLAGEHIVPLIEKSIGKKQPAEMIGPVLGGMLMGHFLFRPVIMAIGEVTLDAVFYEQYIRLVSHMLLYGLGKAGPGGRSITAGD
ncbi:TetR/AcrR family transcriptional regulator [bacterium]|nr:TetR/AcrR family transcriptional regulator [candidate division CSSED10-310 bacterium]